MKKQMADDIIQEIIDREYPPESDELLVTAMVLYALLLDLVPDAIERHNMIKDTMDSADQTLKELGIHDRIKRESAGIAKD